MTQPLARYLVHSNILHSLGSRYRRYCASRDRLLSADAGWAYQMSPCVSDNKSIISHRACFAIGHACISQTPSG
ncbi:hypothetical protein RRG08_010017 [Elysia crispata]|uniref:Uncharacterized protein n=1 Tax=Elysia crispata TaxID=231223 RepID=A0AAE0YPZ0_9GAST|nr:hypothetical protein RRG08_010017 [Elysia crispata]